MHISFNDINRGELLFVPIKPSDQWTINSKFSLSQFILHSCNILLSTNCIFINIYCVKLFGRMFFIKRSKHYILLVCSNDELCILTISYCTYNNFIFSNGSYTFYIGMSSSNECIYGMFSNSNTYRCWLSISSDFSCNIFWFNHFFISHNYCIFSN